VHNLLNDGEAEPGPTPLAGRDEGLEQRSLDLFRNAAPGVGHTEYELAGLAAHAHGKRALELAHCLNGVAHEVVDDAGDLRLIEARCPAVLELDDEPDIRARELLCDLLLEVFEELRQVNLAH